MGLLDDAIREHLELKLRHGADPGAVEQEEHEALDPVIVEPAAAVAEASGDPAELYEDAAFEAPAPAAQDTAEIDMATVLEHDGELEIDDSQLEWEMPDADEDDAGSEEPA